MLTSTMAAPSAARSLTALLLLCCTLSSHGQQLPPRLSSKATEIRVTEGQTGVMLECNLDLGDDPIQYRWFDKDMRWVTASLGHSYRGYKSLLLALHPIRRQHAGTYTCEATNDVGVDTVRIKIIVEMKPWEPPAPPVPKTNEVLAELAVGLSDVLSENDCLCDVMFAMHASRDAPPDLVGVQGNLIHTIASTIISKRVRVSVVSYSDDIGMNLAFGSGTNLCALRKALENLNHKKWSTKLQVLMRDVFKIFMKSTSSCKVLFLPVVGSVGTDGIDLIGAQHLKKINVTIFLLEVTNDPIAGLAGMASKRNDDKPYHWRVPMGIWPSIVTYMQYMTEEMTGCFNEDEDEEYVCVEEGGRCSLNEQCKGAGMGCLQGYCQSLECNVNPNTPGCCSVPGRFWCGDVTRNCTSSLSFCDGRVHCMNGRDEDTCWSRPCPPNRVAQCESTTLCLSLSELCDDHYHCPAGEDEDLNFCSRFPCPSERSFSCRNGKCIAAEKLCDGMFMDCEEGEDENLQYCSKIHRCSGKKAFKCDYGVCIENTAVCDGVYNCLDGTDEIECSRTTCPIERPFKCSNGECIKNDVVCNGHADGCSDGSDEHRCADFSCPAERSFKCNNGRCIDGWLVCNKGDDCGDGTDEQGCTEEEQPLYFPSTSSPRTPAPTTQAPHSTTEHLCGPKQFSCASGACIPESRVCDGRAACADGDDELNCEALPCPADRPHRCPGSNACVDAVVCNGVTDCPDNSDELDCAPVNSGDHDATNSEDDYIFKGYHYDDDDTMIDNNGIDSHDDGHHPSENEVVDHHPEPESEPEQEPDVDLVHPDDSDNDEKSNNQRHGHDIAPAGGTDDDTMTAVEFDDDAAPAAATHDKDSPSGACTGVIGSPVITVTLTVITLILFRVANIH